MIFLFWIVYFQVGHNVAAVFKWGTTSKDSSCCDDFYMVYILYGSCSYVKCLVKRLVIAAAVDRSPLDCQ